MRRETTSHVERWSALQAGFSAIWVGLERAGGCSTFSWRRISISVRRRSGRLQNPAWVTKLHGGSLSYQYGWRLEGNISVSRLDAWVAATKHSDGMKQPCISS